MRLTPKQIQQEKRQFLGKPCLLCLKELRFTKLCRSENAKDIEGFIAWDHCHKCGHFRGYICGPCNYRLGILERVPNHHYLGRR